MNALIVEEMIPLLQVFDMPSSLRFYADILGCRVVMDDGQRLPDCDWVMLELNSIRFMLNTAYERRHRPECPDNARTVAHGDVCLYFSCHDVAGAYEYLRGQSIPVKAPVLSHYGMLQLYVPDPDGFNLCFQKRA
ncbi:MAG TPA: VOC family protein [Candidatus Baltobacteraceae bacterium]|jgi:catechol 2,3-dioxygenase-like lactoylglutathione lyase family enzyme|nr:VOC family protein [Candidatus Baltobacteraceae bacterium]